ncbi:VC0807 family protein [Pseudonocardia phyllosphaerae]|uniref:VC0807 family protein n=1 Tax=Pseudonocardia phyllosphaerae TaxID=3390502 RepID=UPI003979DDB7
MQAVATPQSSDTADDTAAATDAPAPRTTGAPGRGTAFRTFLRSAGPSLLIDAALPYAVYATLSAHGVSDVAALAFSAIPPALNVAWQAVRSRKLNGIGAFVLVTIGIGLATSLISGDPRFAVARDALQSIVFGVLLAGSLVIGRRPLLFHVMRLFAGARDPEIPARMVHQWETNPAFRRVVRRATVIGALVMAAETALRITLAYTLPVAVAMPLLSAQSVVVWMGLSLLLVVAMKRTVRAAR